MTTATDRFSLRRALHMGLFYRRSITRQVWCGVSITLLTFVMLMLSLHLSHSFRGLYLLSSIAMSLFISLVALVFNQRDETLLAQLPVSPAEKMVFYVGYPILLFLALEALWMALCGVAGAVTGGNMLKESVMMLTQLNTSSIYDIQPWWFYMVNGFVQTFFGIMLVLWVVICANPQRRTIKAVGAYFGIFMVVGIISGLLGFVIGFSDALHDLPEDPGHVIDIVSEGIIPYVFVLDIIGMSVTAWGMTRIYGHLKGL